MIIHYNLETLDVISAAYIFGKEYRDHINGDDMPKNFIEIDGHIPIDQLYVFKQADGVIAVAQKKSFQVVCAATTVTLGADIKFTEVPEGAAISFDGDQIGVMDASGQLSIATQTAGIHNFRFSLSGYVNGSFSIEVISQS